MPRPSVNTLFNPFPGLRPFQSDEEHLFFGREKQTLELLQRLRDHRFVAVVGTSGSGKSSLVRCGLLAELQGGSFLEAGTEWEIAVMHPGGDPYRHLAEAILEAEIYDPDEEDALLKIGATLSRSRFGLVETIRQAHLPESTNVLLVVDQFEENFRFGEAGEREGETADDFVGLLLEAASQSTVPVYVVITMRSDYIGDCSRFEGLPEAVNHGEYLIPRLTREEYKSVIEGPIKVGRGELTPRLLQRLLNDIGDQADQLPCLQHALMRTWEAWSQREGAEALDLEDYRTIGGMSEALSIHADEIYDALPNDDLREAAARTFRALTEKGEDNRGVRRPLRLKTLGAITGHRVQDVEAVIDPYREPGVTFLMPTVDQELEPDTVIDISHESLMRVWRRLRNWVEEEAQSARIYQRLVETAALWKQGQAGLFHDPDLQIAQSWRREQEPNAAWAELYGGQFSNAEGFLDQSQRAAEAETAEREAARQRELEQAQQLAETRERAARNFKRFAIGMAMVAVAALGAFGFAIRESHRAKDARDRATLSAQQARDAQNLAKAAEERVRLEFVRSDISLGHSFLEQDKTATGTAHLARALAQDPDNPAVIDRLYHLFAYQNPPGHRSPPFQLPETVYYGGRVVYSTASTADGALVATGVWGTDADVHLWRPWDSTPVYTYKIADEYVYHRSLVISPDSTRLVIGNTDDDNHAQLMEVASGTLRQLPTTTSSGFHFSEDGRRMLFEDGVRNQGSLILWDCEGESILTKHGAERGQRFVPFDWSVDETKVLLARYADNGATSAIFELATGRVLHTLQNDIKVTGGIFSPDASQVLVLRENSPQSWIWTLASGRKVELNHQPVPLAVDQSEIYWGERTGRSDPTQIYTTGGFTPDGQRVLTAGTDLTVRLWDAETGQPLGEARTLPKPVAPFCEAHFSADGKRVMLEGRDGSCYYAHWGPPYQELPSFSEPRPITEGYAFLATASMLRPLVLPRSGVLCGRLHPRELWMALGTRAGEIVLFDLTTGDQLGAPFEHADEVAAIRFNEDGSNLVALTPGGVIRIWETSQPQNPVTTTSDPSAIVTGGDFDVDVLTLSTEIAAVHPDGKTQVTLWDSDTIFVANAHGRRLARNLNADSDIACLEFSPSGRTLAAGLQSGQVRLWQWPSGEPSGHLPIHGVGQCIDIAFDETERLLATVFANPAESYAVVWDAATGRQLSGKLGTGTPFCKAAFLEGGQRLVVWPDRLPDGTESPSGLVSIWDVSVSDGKEAPDWLPEVVTSFGGIRLDEESLPVAVTTRQEPPANAGHERLSRFFSWLHDFPGTRADSPFRPVPSDEYVNQLINQNDFYLLEEAVRLRPRNARALARRGVGRLHNQSSSPGAQVLTTVDLERAKLLAPEDAEVAWYDAIRKERENASAADAAFEHARSLGPLTLPQLVLVLEVHERFGLGGDNRRAWFDQGVALARESGEEKVAKELIAKRFLWHVANQDYAAALSDWMAIKEWEAVPATVDVESLWSILLAAAESEVDRLSEIGRSQKAMALAGSFAVIAELDESIANAGELDIEGWVPASLLTKMIEEKRRQHPPLVVIPKNAEWKYLDDGTDQGIAWREPGFDDSQWNQGPAKLGYGDDGEVTVLETGPEDAKHITCYFRHRFDLSEAQLTEWAYLNLVYDDGAVVYVNGQEVLRSAMPAGEIDYSTEASGTRRSANERDAESHYVSARQLVVGENVVAVEVHQRDPESSDLGFALEFALTEDLPGNVLTDHLVEDHGAAFRDSILSLVPRGLRPRYEAVLAMTVGLNIPKDTSRSHLEWEAAGRFLWKAGKLAEFLDLADQRVQALQPSYLPADVAAAKRWLARKERVQIALVRPVEEINATLSALHAMPARDPSRPVKQIDLTESYNAGIYDHRNWCGNPASSLRLLPGSFTPRHGVDFDFRGAIQLESGPVDDEETLNDKYGHFRRYPDKVEGISIGQKSSAIHFMISSHWGREQAGVEVAKLVMHYEQGDPNELPIIYGQDVADWYTAANTKPIPRPKLGWRGRNGGDNNDVELSEIIWENPFPDKTITHIDFVSSLKAAAPFIVGITLE